MLLCVSIVRRYNNVADTAVRVVESPSPLLVIVSLQGRRQDIERTRVSVECEIPVVEVFARCVRLWLSDSDVLWRDFDTDCPIVLTASASPDTAAFIAVLDDF